MGISANAFKVLAVQPAYQVQNLKQSPRSPEQIRITISLKLDLETYYQYLSNAVLTLTTMYRVPCPKLPKVLRKRVPDVPFDLLHAAM